MFGYSKLNEGGKNLPAPAKLPPPSEVSKQKSQSDRIATFITGLGTKANVDPGCLSNAEPFIKMAIKFFSPSRQSTRSSTPRRTRSTSSCR